MGGWAWLVVAAAALGLAGAAVLVVSRRVPGAAEALVVTGRRPRVVTGRGTFVVPGVSRAARLDLSLRPMQVDVEAVSAEGIAFAARVAVSWTIDPDERSVTRAARHFATRPDLAGETVGGSVVARTRAAVGALPGRALLDGGSRLAAAGPADAVAGDLAAVGLRLVSLDVVAVDDRSGYLADLARPEALAASTAARVAAARAEQAAVDAEQATATATARARRDAAVTRAGFDGDVDRHEAWARHAVARADAQAQARADAPARDRR